MGAGSNVFKPQFSSFDFIFRDGWQYKSETSFSQKIRLEEHQKAVIHGETLKLSMADYG